MSPPDTTIVVYKKKRAFPGDKKAQCCANLKGNVFISSALTAVSRTELTFFFIASLFVWIYYRITRIMKTKFVKTNSFFL